MKDDDYKHSMNELNYASAWLNPFRELKETESANKTLHSLMVSGEQRGYDKAEQHFKAKVTELQEAHDKMHAFALKTIEENEALEASVARKVTLLEDSVHGSKLALTAMDEMKATIATLEADKAWLDGSAINLIEVERGRQISQEGWSLAHDDQHTDGSLAVNAAILAANGTDAEIIDHHPNRSPWSITKHSRERELVIAAALLVAEIERLQRAAIKEDTK